jgi:hypothetical protein
MSTPRNDAAFSRKTVPGPVDAVVSPPSAGPTARARLKATAPSATAAARSARDTSSGVIACQAGAVIAEPIPRANVRPSRSSGVTRPASVSPPSVAAATSIHVCVTSSRRRRSTTSASAPAGNASRKNGRLAAVCMSATSRGEGASVVISHAPAASCIHVPRLDTSDASQMRR